MNKIILSAVLSAIVIASFASPTYAKTATSGKVTFLGTLTEKKSGTEIYARFRLRLTDSNCDGTKLKTRWIHVESGRGDGKYVHNMVNFRNAYSTLMAAMLSGKRIQFGGIPSCGSSTQTVKASRADIGVY